MIEWVIADSRVWGSISTSAKYFVIFLNTFCEFDKHFNNNKNYLMVSTVNC